MLQIILNDVDLEKKNILVIFMMSMSIYKENIIIKQNKESISSPLILIFFRF